MALDHYEISDGQSAHFEGQARPYCLEFEEVRAEVVFYSAGLIGYGSMIVLILFDFEEDCVCGAVSDSELNKLNVVDVG